MAAATTVEIGTLLWMMPSASGGRLCLAGTGISVVQISCLYNEGLTPQEIAESYPTLDLPRIHAAIAHYLANKSAMDAQMEADSREYDEDKLYYETHGKLPPKYG
jgi:uncharacterized protein (DUF433 family)